MACNTNEQAITTGSNLVFPTVTYQSGISINYTPGTNTIYLTTPGLYQISLDVVITNETENTETTVQMYKDGVLIPGALAEVTVTAIGDLHPGHIEAVVASQGCPCPCNKSTAITFVVTGTTPAISNANVVVVKIA